MRGKGGQMVGSYTTAVYRLIVFFLPIITAVIIRLILVLILVFAFPIIV